MTEQMSDPDRLMFVARVADNVIDALDAAWHDGMKIGREHQKGFQDRIEELEEEIRGIRRAQELPGYWCKEYWKQRDKNEILRQRMKHANK